MERILNKYDSERNSYRSSCMKMPSVDIGISERWIHQGRSRDSPQASRYWSSG